MNAGADHVRHGEPRARDHAREAAKAAGRGSRRAPGRSDFPNQINNVLAFPGIFRGALDVRASDINDDMMEAAAYAIAGLVDDEHRAPDYIIPGCLRQACCARRCCSRGRRCAQERGCEDLASGVRVLERTDLRGRAFGPPSFRDEAARYSGGGVSPPVTESPFSSDGCIELPYVTHREDFVRRTALRCTPFRGPLE